MGMTRAGFMTQYGQDPIFWIGLWPIWVMTETGHDRIQNLDHGRDPVMTHNTIYNLISRYSGNRETMSYHG